MQQLPSLRRSMKAARRRAKVSSLRARRQRAMIRSPSIRSAASTLRRWRMTMRSLRSSLTPTRSLTLKLVRKLPSPLKRRPATAPPLSYSRRRISRSWRTSSSSQMSTSALLEKSSSLILSLRPSRSRPATSKLISLIRRTLLSRRSKLMTSRRSRSRKIPRP